jgi:hypothetical protein
MCIRDRMGHYLEEVLLTSRATGIDRAVFEWCGYGPLRSWLASRQAKLTTPEIQRQQGVLTPETTEGRILEFYFELLVDEVEVSSPAQLRALLPKVQRLQGARDEMRRLNREFWALLDSSSQEQRASLILDYERRLEERVRAVQREMQETLDEIAVVKKRPAVRLVTGLASWAQSAASLLAPLPAVDEMKDSIEAGLSRKIVEGRRGSLDWVITFQNYGAESRKSLVRRPTLENKSALLPPSRIVTTTELRDYQLCEAAGITMEQLFQLEDCGLIAPASVSWEGWSSYSEQQIDVARTLASGLG